MSEKILNEFFVAFECVHDCARAFMRAYVHVCVCEHVRACVRACVSECVHARARVHVRVCVCARARARVHVRVCTHAQSMMQTYTEISLIICGGIVLFTFNYTRATHKTPELYHFREGRITRNTNEGK